MKLCTLFLASVSAQNYDFDLDYDEYDYEERYLLQNGTNNNSTTDCSPISTIVIEDISVQCCQAITNFMGFFKPIKPLLNGVCPAGNNNCHIDGVTPKNAIATDAIDEMCGNQGGCANSIIQGLSTQEGSDNQKLLDAIKPKQSNVPDMCMMHPVTACNAPSSIELNDDNAVPVVDASSYYVTLDCKAGYQPQQGTNDPIYCVANQGTPNFRWVNDTLICDPKSCGSTPADNAIALNCNGSTFGSTCTASCTDSNKHLNMGFGYNCELGANGSVAWKGAAGCGVSTCAWTAIANSASDTCDATMADGATCAVTCTEGYDLKGTVECTKGTFTKMAKCVSADKVFEEVTYVKSKLSLNMDISVEDANSEIFKDVVASSIASTLGNGLTKDDVEILSVTVGNGNRRRLAAQDLTIDFRVKVEDGSTADTAVMNVLTSDQNAFATSFSQELTNKAAAQSITVQVNSVAVAKPQKVVDYKEVVNNTTTPTVTTTPSVSTTSQSGVTTVSGTTTVVATTTVAGTTTVVDTTTTVEETSTTNGCASALTAAALLLPFVAAA